MTENESKEQRLKIFLKDQVRQNLLLIGRRLVAEKGPEFLTARKLSEASGVSVGTIYNIFATMDNFIMAQNLKTLHELDEQLCKIVSEANPYMNLNRYTDVVGNFVISHAHLWSLLFQQHLKGAGKLPLRYILAVKRIERHFDEQLARMFPQLSKAEKRLAAQVLEMSLFALSGFQASSGWRPVRQVRKENIGKLLLNTYLAGLAALKR